MFSLLILDKAGTISEKNVKSLDRLYGICNYRNEEGFEELHQWTVSTASFVLFGKRNGKNNCENQTALPFPLEAEVFYGTLCMVKRVGGELVSLTLDEWTRISPLIHVEETKSEEKELRKEEYEPEH